jgi:hypothetical protein
MGMLRLFSVHDKVQVRMLNKFITTLALGSTNLYPEIWWHLSCVASFGL